MPPHAHLADADASASSPLGSAQRVTSVSGVGASVDPSASNQPWDGLSEPERRLQLESMDSDDVRSLAASMPTIEQAKGVLMGCFGVDAAAAFAILCRLSSTKNVKLRDVAAVVVRAASARTSDPEASTPAEEVCRALGGAPVGDPEHGR